MEADTLFLNFLELWGRVILNREMKIFYAALEFVFCLFIETYESVVDDD
jgi:hypothetical protein